MTETVEQIARRLSEAGRLNELAARVEALTEPDREVDADIAVAVSGDPDAWVVKPHPDSIFTHKPGWYRTNTNLSVKAPEFTTSLDAALTLAPDGWKLRQMALSAPCADDRAWHLNLRGGREGEDAFVGRGKSPALALCAAALRARAHLQEQGS